MDLDRLAQSGMELLDRKLFSLAGAPVTITTLITFVLIVCISWFLARLLEKAVEKAFRMRGVTDEGTIGVARRLLHYLVLLIGISVGLQTVGIHLGALFAAGAIFAVAIGFAMQNLTQNFVSGVLLLLERTIKPGDILEVEGRRVKVSSMGIRTTIVRTKNDEDIIVPNSVLVSSSVKNFTLRDPLNRLRVLVGVVYASDMKRVHETLISAAESLSWRSDKKPPQVLMMAFGASSVDFEVSVWIDDPWIFQQRLSDLHQAIWWALESAGIVIAFPQLDLHLDPVVTAALADRKVARLGLPEHSVADP